MRSLVIDDDMVCRRVLVKFLGRLGACQAANDGAEGLAMIRDSFQNRMPFRLICLDVAMPLLDGHQVLAEIRDMEDRLGISSAQRTLVMMVTAMDEGSHVMRAFRAQCDAYLVKPIEAGRLTTELGKLGLIP
jgi:two-component system chemotaxis response regulator CheY